MVNLFVSHMKDMLLSIQNNLEKAKLLRMGKGTLKFLCFSTLLYLIGSLWWQSFFHPLKKDIESSFHQCDG